MAKSAMVENVVVSLFGGVVTATLNVIVGHGLPLEGKFLFWSFVTGVFVVSLSLLIGKLVASKIA